MHGRRPFIDDGRVEEDFQMQSRLLERGQALGDDGGEQDRHEAEGQDHGQDAQATEYGLAAMAARQCGADAGGGGRGAVGAGCHRGLGHYSYCSRKRRTM